jgi:predicted lactoylglutathione lyase
MKPRINFITLAVRDLRMSFEFYKNGLGWPSQVTVEEVQDHVLFELENGFSLVLYNLEDFSGFTGHPQQTPGTPVFILSQYADSKEEADEAMDRALKAGAQEIGERKDEPWGYTASFADPDGHIWEIFYSKNGSG